MSAPQWGHVAEWLRSGLQNSFGCSFRSPTILDCLVSLAFSEPFGLAGTGSCQRVLLSWVPVAVPT
jgi:hypothetical protein